MKRDVYLFISDILENIDLITNSVKDVSKEKFVRDLNLRDATVRRLEIIGEAVKNVPFSFRDKYQDVPWKDIAGFRDVILHSYFRVDLELLWTVVKEELPDLKIKILKVSQDLKEETKGMEK